MTLPTPLLDAIKRPEDLRRLPEDSLRQVADELRAETINAVAVTGGHLGAGLGVVELTVALHYVFDTPGDRLIWDVGHQAIEIGKGRIVREGTSVALLSLGTRLAECLKAAETLATHGLSATVADARFAKPLDTDLVLRLAREHEVLITVEEGSVGGFAAQVLQTLAEHGALDRGLKLRAMVLPDQFIDQDSPVAMYAKAGLDANAIAGKVFQALGRDVRMERIQSTRL